MFTTLKGLSKKCSIIRVQFPGPLIALWAFGIDLNIYSAPTLLGRALEGLLPIKTSGREPIKYEYENFLMMGHLNPHRQGLIRVFTCSAV